MKHTSTKFFIMFLAGILFSAITVFAATVTVNTDFTENAVQYLQQLVLTDASGTTTGVVIDGINKKIQSDTICSTNGTNCKEINSLFTGVDTDTHLTTGQVDIMVSDNGYLTGESWHTNGDSIYYTGGNIGIGLANPNKNLVVSGNFEATKHSDFNTMMISSGLNATSISFEIGTKLDNSGLKIANTNIATMSLQRNNTTAGNDLGKIQFNRNADHNSGIRAIISYHDGSGFNFSTDNSALPHGALISRMNLTTDGDLGIGTNHPQAKLDVNGGIVVGYNGICSGNADAGKMSYGTFCSGTTVYSTFDICIQSGSSTLVEWYNIVPPHPMSDLSCGGGSSGGSST